MKLQLLWVGKTSFPFIDTGIKMYQSRINHYAKFDIVEIKENKKVIADKLLVRKIEGEAILSKLQPSDLVVLLDEKGTEYDSTAFASYLNTQALKGVKRIVFIIGGAWGFSNEVYARANHSLSLSKMTFSHQIVRVLFLEQLYRALTIIKGEPYHHQ